MNHAYQLVLLAVLLWEFEVSCDQLLILTTDDKHLNGGLY